MWKGMARYEEILHFAPGKARIELAGKNSQVSLNLLVDFHDMITQHVRIADRQRPGASRGALANNAPISPKGRSSRT